MPYQLRRYWVRYRHKQKPPRPQKLFAQTDHIITHSRRLLVQCDTKTLLERWSLKVSLLERWFLHRGQNARRGSILRMYCLCDYSKHVAELVVNQQCLAYRASGLWLGHGVNNCIPRRQIAVCTVTRPFELPPFLGVACESIWIRSWL